MEANSDDLGGKRPGLGSDTSVQLNGYFVNVLRSEQWPNNRWIQRQWKRFEVSEHGMSNTSKVQDKRGKKHMENWWPLVAIIRVLEVVEEWKQKESLLRPLIKLEEGSIEETTGRKTILNWTVNGCVWPWSSSSGCRMSSIVVDLWKG